MYENMVKEAYENIVGVEKEAAFDGIKAKLSTGARRREEDAVERTKNRVGMAQLYNDQAHNRAAARVEVGKRRLAHTAERMSDAAVLANKNIADSSANRAAKMEAARAYLEAKDNLKASKNTQLARAYNDFMNGAQAEADRKVAIRGMKKDIRNLRYGQYADIADAKLQNAAAHENRLHARVNEIAAQKAAEKAAAYYDEAQLVKEAAEVDYNEACAYEDAALEVLAELGYDVDELCKEAGIKDVAGTACGAVKNFGKGYVDALKGAGIREDLIRNKNLKTFNSENASDAIRKQFKGKLPKDIAKTVGAYALPIAAISGATAYGVHRHNKRKTQAQEQAEKAAAYYEDAQLVKEAAYNDYMEACAYEDAAVEALYDLGYFED